jgi:hypothetical protein
VNKLLFRIFFPCALTLALLAALPVLVGAMQRPDESAGAGNNLDASAKAANCIGPKGAPCSELRYSLLLANAGPALPYVRVLDPLPAGVEYIPGSASERFNYDPGRNAMLWFGSLQERSAMSLTFAVRSLVSMTTAITNTAFICTDLTAASCISRSALSVLDPVPPATPTPTATPTVPPQSLQCGLAMTMTLDTAIYTGTTHGAPAGVTFYGCAPGWLETGPEAIYALDVDQPVADFSVELLSAQGELDLFVLRDCDPLTCIVAGDRLVRVNQPVGRYYILVDGRNGAVGNYILQLTWTPAEATPPVTASPTATASPTMTPGPPDTTTPTVTATGTPSATPAPATPTWTATATRTPPRPTATFTPQPSPTPTFTLPPIVRRGPILPLIVAGFPRPPAPSPTPTPSYPVSLDAIWLEGPRGSRNYDFRICEVMYESLRVSNWSPASVPVWIDWIVRDYDNRKVAALSLENWGPVALPGGFHADINLPAVVPPGAPLGSYTLVIRLRDQRGLIAQRLLYFSVSGEDPITSPLAEMVLTHGVADGLPIDSVPDGKFSVTDQAIYAWTWWQRATGKPQEIRWVWYRPDNRVYTTYRDTFSAECTFYAWGWLPIAGTEVARLPGMWKLEIWLDGRLITTRAFEIVNLAGQMPGQGPATAGGGHLDGPCTSPTCEPPPPR